MLEKHGCSVFMPDVVKNKLDWNYLAGYESVKRHIEDTVLFEGPPGCGKTTSAKIISH